MNGMFKKIFTLLLSVFLLLVYAPSGFADYERVLIEAENFIGDSGMRNGSAWTPTCAGLNPRYMVFLNAASVSYAVTIPADGVYEVVMYAGLTDNTGQDSLVTISENAVILTSGEIEQNGNYGQFDPNRIGIMNLTAGTHTLTFSMDGNQRAFQFDYITFTRVNAYYGEASITTEAEWGTYQSAGAATRASESKTNARGARCERLWGYSGDSLSYTVTVPLDGTYAMHFYGDGVDTETPSEIQVLLDDTEVLSTEIAGCEDYYAFNEHVLGEIYLRAGSHTVTLRTKQKACYFDCFTLTYKTEALQQEAEAYASVSGAEVADGDMLRMPVQSSAIYTLTVAENGYYALKIKLSADGAHSFGVSVNGRSAGKKSILATTTSSPVVIQCATIYLAQGVNQLLLEHTAGDNAVLVDRLELYRPRITLYKNQIADANKLEFLESGHLIASVQRNGLFENEPTFAALALYRQNTLIACDVQRLGETDNTNTVFLELTQSLTDLQNCLAKIFVWNGENLWGECRRYESETAGNIFYVSTDGSDEAAGTRNHPFRTLSRAKTAVAARHDSLCENLEVCISAGSYVLEETETFRPENGGTDEYSVTYRGNDPDNPPVINGGVQITEWQRDGDIWKASVPTNVSIIRNLYVDDRPAVRARSREEFTVKTVKNNVITVKESVFPSISDAQNLELVWNLEWETQRTPVSAISSVGSTTLTLDEACFAREEALKQRAPGIAVSAGKRFYLENAKELLDEAGEFYYDTAEKVIYYYPYSGQDMQTAACFVGQTELLFDIGGYTASDTLKNTVFENLDFRYGAWNYVSENGYIGVQSDMILSETNDVSGDQYMQITAQVTLNNTDGVDVKNCRFSCLGSTALGLTDGVKNTEISGNAFYDISGMAISVGTWRHEAAESNRCSNLSIGNNAIRRVAAEYHSCPAIGVYYEKNVLISHNDIRNLPYSGISLGWGWGTAASNHNKWGDFEVAHNRIENVMTTLADGAHIYTLGDLKGTDVSKIHDNYLKKSLHWRGGIYNDSGSANLEIYANVFDLVLNLDVAKQTHWWRLTPSNGNNIAPHDITAYNNYVTEGTSWGWGQADGNVCGLNLESWGNTEFSNAALPTGSQSIMNTAGLTADYQTLLRLTGASWNPDELPSVLVGAETYGINTGTVTAYGHYIQLARESVCTYEVYVPVSGLYELRVRAYPYKSKGDDSVLKLIQNENVLCSVTVSGQDDASAFADYTSGSSFTLDAGQNTFTFGAPDGYGCYVDYFILEPVA